MVSIKAQNHLHRETKPQLKVWHIRISHSLIRKGKGKGGMPLYINEGSLKITSPVQDPAHGSFQPSFVAYNLLGRLYTR